MWHSAHPLRENTPLARRQLMKRQREGRALVYEHLEGGQRNNKKKKNKLVGEWESKKKKKTPLN